MKIVEKYTGDKIYMFPNGALATKEAVLEQFPAALTFVHVVETDENREVMWAFENLSAMRSTHNIDPTLSESEAIEVLQESINATSEYEADPTPSTTERIAAALEFQNLMMMDDVSSNE